jgi:hypothetical protein
MNTLGAIFSAWALEAEVAVASALAPRSEAIRVRQDSMMMKRAMFARDNREKLN